MAEVLSPFIQQSGSMTILHTKSDAYQNNTSSSQSQSSRSSQMPRTHYNNQNGGTGYRGTSAAPISPYAFQQTPQLQHRTPSGTSVPYSQIHLKGTPNQNTNLNVTPQQTPPRWPAHAPSSSDSTNSTVSSARSHAARKEDSLIASSQATTPSKASEDTPKRTLDGRPISTISFSSSVPDLSLVSLNDLPAKPSPDRYRRNVRRTESGHTVQTPPATQPASSYMAAGTFQQPMNFDGPPNGRPVHQRTISVDDMQLPKQTNEQAKRYRRRSLGGFEGESTLR